MLIALDEVTTGLCGPDGAAVVYYGVPQPSTRCSSPQKTHMNLPNTIMGHMSLEFWPRTGSKCLLAALVSHPCRPTN